MRRTRLFVVLAAAFAMAAGESAWAHTIAVRRPDASDHMLVESFSRLCGELRMYGLEVRLVDETDDAAHEKLAGESSPSGDLIGGVSLVRTPGQASAKIWVAANAAGKENVRITVSIDDADAPSLLAIRAADLLHASLRRLQPAELSAPGPESEREAKATMTAGSAQAAPPGSPVWGWIVQAGPAALVELGKLGAGWGANVQVQKSISHRLAITLAFTAPVLGQTYASTAATAHVRHELGTVAVVFRLTGTSLLEVDLFQGVGAMHLSLHGEADSPWVAQDASAWAAASSTGASISLRLSERWGVRASVAGIFLLPRPVIDAAEASYVARQPLLLTNLGLWFGL
jgi:hypothetical protein